MTPLPWLNLNIPRMQRNGFPRLPLPISGLGSRKGDENHLKSHSKTAALKLSGLTHRPHDAAQRLG